MTLTAPTGSGTRTRRVGSRRTLRTLLRLAEWVVLGVAVVACAVFSVGTLTGRLLLQTVPTGSMEPVIPKGSAIMVEHKDVSSIQVGDVIVFAAPETGTMTVHRVIEIGETDGSRTFTTKGDNNPGPDPWTLRLEGQKVHKVTTVLPALGTILTSAGKPQVRFPLIAIGGLLVVVAGLVAIWRGERRRAERRQGERRHGDRRRPSHEAPTWPAHLERRIGERRMGERRTADRRAAGRGDDARRHDDSARRWSDERIHGRTSTRARRGRVDTTAHRAGRTVATTVAAITVFTLVPTTVAHASFTGARTAQTTLGTGSLAVPASVACRWTSGTTADLTWALSDGIQTNTEVLQQSSVNGTITIATTIASTATSASVTPASPVTTPSYLSARTTKGTWTSAQSTQITTDRCGGSVVAIAGNGTATYAGDNGAATAASLNTPNQVAEGPDGRVYIADTANNRIRVIDTSGTITTIAGGGASSACSFTGAATGLSLRTPQGVAVDGSGNVYVADTGNNCIRRIDSAGTVTRVAGGGTTTTCGNGTIQATALSLSAPAGVALAPNGDVIVADTGRNCIRRVSGSNVTRVAGGGATTTCSSTALTAGNLSLSAPQGVAVAGNGDVIVADTGRNCVRRISGTSATLVAGGGATTACASTTPTGVSLSAPEAVAIAPNGDILIADTGRSCLRRATATAVSQAAFTGTGGSAGDNGPAVGATTRSPAGLAVTAAGDLLVADRSNSSGSSDVRLIRAI